MITKKQALETTHGQELHRGSCNNPKHLTRFRVSGSCQTWKTRPTQFRLPIKYGLYGNTAVDQDNAEQFHLAADCPLRNK